MGIVANSIIFALVMAGLGPVRGAGAFAPARLRIEPAGRVELGELGPLEIRTRSYRFANLSAAPIALRVLDLSPGVSVAGPALERPIPGGGSAGLDLRVDPAGWSGPQARNVRLGTDDPGQGSFYLPVRMTVRHDLTVDGRQPEFRRRGQQREPVHRVPVRPGNRQAPRPAGRDAASGLPGMRAPDRRAKRPAGLHPASGPDPAGHAPGARPGRGWRPTRRWSRGSTSTWNGGCITRSRRSRCGWCSWCRTRTPWSCGSGRAAGRPSGSWEAELEGDGFQLDLPSGPPAPEQTLRVRRTAAAAARAMLVLRCSGQDVPLRIPIAYQPDRPAIDEDVIVVPNTKG